MTIVLRQMTREAADAILSGRPPGDVRVADDYPTEFSAGAAQVLGADGQVGPFLIQRVDSDLVVGEIGGAFVSEGIIEIGYAVVESQWNRGYATAAVSAFLTMARETVDGASDRRTHSAQPPAEWTRAREGGLHSRAGDGR